MSDSGANYYPFSEEWSLSKGWGCAWFFTFLMTFCYDVLALFTGCSLARVVIGLLEEAFLFVEADSSRSRAGSLFPVKQILSDGTS